MRAAHYFASAAALAGWRFACQDDDHPASCAWHATHSAPNNPNVFLVLVGEWQSSAMQRAFEALPGVQRIYPEALSQIVPPLLASAFADAGVLATDTGRQALTKIRQWWAHPAVGEGL